MRRHRLALGALLYVRGATAASSSSAAASASAAAASKLYEGVRTLEGREVLLRHGSVPPAPIQLDKLPRFLHPFATAAASQAASSAVEPPLHEGDLYGRVHGMAPCTAGASSGEAAAGARAPTGAARAAEPG